MTIVEQYRPDPHGVPFRIAARPRLATVREAPDWSLAACRGLPSSLFFAEHGDSPSVSEARAVCATCPIRVECLDYAVSNGERWGVWGGLTPQERRPGRLAGGADQ